ncbi:programmed cell death protein 1 isoform X1 [Pezoporus occidentalis]|uniref:programmed cell death protein 1 isoform X1 n=2 Tax=Pezoporus occidentalis TaxID=407982 RepID=UPI002F90FE50
MGMFHFHPSSCCAHQRTSRRCGEGSTEKSWGGTAHLPGQKTDWLAMALVTSKTTWGSMEVTLIRLCTVLLCCGPMLVGCRQVTFFPAMLTLPAGGSATFFCNISMENESSSEYSLNWYKETNHSQAQKIAEIGHQISQINGQVKTEKYLLTNHTPAFKLEILNLHQNDSGSYFCGLITFSEHNNVMESNRSQLVVTAAPEKTNTTDEPETEESNPPDYIKAMLLGILLLAGVVVLLIFGYLTITYRRGDVQKPQSKNAPAAPPGGVLLHLLCNPIRRKRSPLWCPCPLWTMVCWSFTVTSTCRSPRRLHQLSRPNTPPSSSQMRSLSHQSRGRNTQTRGCGSCSSSPAEGWVPPCLRGAGRDRLPWPLTPTTGCRWEKSSVPGLEQKMMLLDLTLDSPGFGGTMAIGWVPGDKEGPCRASHATSSHRAGRRGCDRSAMPIGLSQR